MKNMKLPRKLKKGLKKAVVAKYPNWKTHEIAIGSISCDQRYRRHPHSVYYKHLLISAHTMGANTGRRD